MEKETGKWVVSLHDISKIFLRYPYGYSFFFATDKETVLTWILSDHQVLNNCSCTCEAIFDARETTGTRINCCVVTAC